MTKQHIHAELIKAWAHGAEIEVLLTGTSTWEPVTEPRWLSGCVYRVKTEPIRWAMGDKVAYKGMENCYVIDLDKVDTRLVRIALWVTHEELYK